MRFGKVMGSFSVVLSVAAMTFGVGCSVSEGDDVAPATGKLLPDRPADGDVPATDCGGELDVDCGAGNYCAADTCGGSGTCQPRPDACTAHEDPVCGCDGVTYSNACVADAAGAGSDYRGECANGGGGECGGELDVACPDGSYCKSEDGMCGGSGVCTRNGDPACIEIYDPVCGCDGETYDNACFAEAAGADIASRGQCTNSKVCGGFAGIACSDDAFCQYEGGTCGEADLQGICVSLPEVCTDEWAPVCGCDGQTHGNSCEAEAAGTSIRHEGACGSNEDSAG